MVEFYRFDASGRIVRVFAGGSLLLLLGALVALLSVLTGQSDGVKAVSATLGLVLTMAGALQTVLRLFLVLREDDYVALRKDGLWIRYGEKEALIGWEAIDRVRVERGGTGRLVVEQNNGGTLEIVHPLADIGWDALATRIRVVMGKARFGWL